MPEKPRPWNPYLCGALAGGVLVASVYFTDKFPGASTTFVRLAGLLESLFDPEVVTANAYFDKVGIEVDWQMMFVLGITAGAFVAAVLSGTFKFTGLPEMWQERFGKCGWCRSMTAFLGGFICLIGARLAGGCPTGHGLSGLSQLSVSALIALPAFLVGAFTMAAALYARRDK